MKNRLLLFCVLLTTTLSAQFSDLIKDKNIAWLAETSMDIRVDMLYEEQIRTLSTHTKVDFTGGLDVLKFQGNKELDMDEGYLLFANIFLTAAKNKQITGFSDSLCLKPIDIMPSITRLDTFFPFSPNTYETSFKVAKTEMNWEDIKLFRLHQIVYYKPKNGEWGIKPISIAPLVMTFDDLGNFISLKPLFWVKVEDKKADLKSEDITWAVRTRPRTIGGNIVLNTVKELKKGSVDMPMKHFLSMAKSDMKMPLYSNKSWREKTLLTLKEREQMFQSVDTIQQVDPITYVTTVKIVSQTLNPDDIQQLRPAQEWAWNNKRKTLSIRFVGIAPMKKVNDDAGNFLFNMPLFFRRFD